MTEIRSLCMAAMISAAGLAWLATPAVAQFPPAPPPTHAPHPKATKESIAAGKEIFAGTCANCHGIDGSGANGPNIRGIGATLGPEGVYTTIRGGVIGTGMPSFTALDDATVWKIVDYVMTLGHEDTAVATGDAQKGKEIYEASKCGTCHAIGAQGGDLGPDLSKIGALRSIVNLKKTLEDPGGNLPTDTSLQERSNYTAYLMYRAVAKDGKVVEGTRVDEDSFTIQLKDASGRLHSIRKSEMQSIEPEPGKSFMPSYKDKLTAAQIDDLVAYLSSLGEAQ
ncbi:MAG TPA: c-type cytochrome [Candidatus Acidoferrales bacterium]|nr:c-type cytochrome [Candidatus Acidoferrales bacterium]